MRVYLSGRFEDRKRLALQRDRLVSMGYEVISSWLDELDGPALGPEESSRVAMRDLQELKSADGLILDTHGTNPRGGREVEWGIGLTRMALRWRVVIGPKRNVFHELATHSFKTWNEAMVWLTQASTTPPSKPSS